MDGFGTCPVFSFDLTALYHFFPVQATGEMKLTERTVSQSIQRDFRRQLWSLFCRAVDTYRLIVPGDRIAVCYSGGKDSSLLACCLRDYQRYSGVDFEYQVLMLDPGYAPHVRETALLNAEALALHPHIVETPIFEAVSSVSRSFCHICASMRRGYLYENAKKLGCGKIALGHHLDDVAETALMSMLFGGQYKGMMPRIESDSHPGMELIRPLYLIRERDIVSWAGHLGLTPVTCACRMTAREDMGAREKTKKMIRALEQETPNVVGNIFGSLSSISLDTVLRYRQDQHSPWVDRYADVLHFPGDSDIMEQREGGEKG